VSDCAKAAGPRLNSLSELQRRGPPVKHPTAAFDELRASRPVTILGERSGSGVEIRGDFGGRGQRLDDSQTFDPPTLRMAVSPSFRIAVFADISQL
jgi:hypothetical protein